MNLIHDGIQKNLIGDFSWALAEHCQKYFDKWWDPIELPYPLGYGSSKINNSNNCYCMIIQMQENLLRKNLKEGKNGN